MNSEIQVKAAFFFSIFLLCIHNQVVSVRLRTRRTNVDSENHSVLMEQKMENALLQAQTSCDNVVDTLLISSAPINPSLSSLSSSPSILPSSSPTFSPTISPTRGTESDQPSLVPTTVCEKGNYKGAEWNNLPDCALYAADILGYDKKMWEKKKIPYTFNLYWVQLSGNEQYAAKLLFGYSEEKWDNESPVVLVDDCSEPSDIGYYDFFSYFQLPDCIKIEAAELGYNEDLWDSDSLSCVDKLLWDMLSNDQKEAAEIFGYDNVSWNNDVV